MSLVDNVLPRRGPGRPRKEAIEMTEVHTALGAPIPDNVEGAVKKVEAAMAAFEVAHSAFHEAAAMGLPQLLEAAVEKAERDLTDAVVQREVADRIGGDGPSDDDLAALESVVAVARANLTSIGTRKAAYQKATDERREALTQAQEEMWQVVQVWVESALEAADRQIAEGVRLISEAQGAADKLATWQQQQRVFPDVRFSSVTKGGDGHRCGRSDVAVPADILRAVHTWRRADRAINRL